jgi:hypothetical protein
MHVVIRRYSGPGVTELLGLLGRSEDEVKNIIRGVPGFVSYELFGSGDSGGSVTICQDKSGTDESSRRAAEWVKANVPVAVNPPEIIEGDTVLHFGP